MFFEDFSFFSEVKLIYNVLISSVHQSDSVIHIYVYILFLRTFKKQKSSSPPSRIIQLSWGNHTPSPALRNPHRSARGETCLPCWPSHGHDCIQWVPHKVAEDTLPRKGPSRNKENMEAGRFPEWVVSIWVRTARILMVLLGKIHILITIFCNLLLRNNDVEASWD